MPVVIQPVKKLAAVRFRERQHLGFNLFQAYDNIILFAVRFANKWWKAVRQMLVYSCPP
jgi:hypothetical protein